MNRVAPFIVVFIASACVMVIELVASRLIAQHVGTNLYTWTSIIAVVLAGISLGNVLGGIAADRVPVQGSERIVAWLLIASGLLALVSILIVDPVFTATITSRMPLPVRILFGVTVSFFLPAVVLGSVSPLAATWAINTHSRLGTTVGGLYAISSMGAIAGTLITGFVLISVFGSIATLSGVAFVLAISALLARRTRSTALGVAFVVSMAVVVAIGGWGAVTSPAAAAGAGNVIYANETQYQTVVVTWDPQRRTRTVMLDNLVHGFVVPEEPRVILYPYIAVYAAAYEVVVDGIEGAVASLHLGGGAFTLPRFIADAFPQHNVIVSEIDPGVTEANHVATRLPRPPPFELHHLDARSVVRQLAAQDRNVDVVFADAFGHYSIPAHLTTVEFYTEVDAILNEGGVVLQNVIDDLRFPRMLASIIATIRLVHPYVSVFLPVPDGGDTSRNTFVVASSRAPINETAIGERLSAMGLPVELVNSRSIFEAIAPSAPVVLTDAFAPVERLVLHLYGGAER